MKGGIGLTKVPTHELERLLRWVHKRETRIPVSRADMLASGMTYLAESGDVLFGLDEPGLRAALVCVLAERRATERAAAARRPEPAESE